MAILRSLLREWKNETLQGWAEEEAEAKFHKSVEVIDATPFYATSEPLKLVFRRDGFERWLGERSADQNNHKLERISLSKSA